MRSQLALCKSERCKSRLQLAADTDTDTPLNANGIGPCRYKFKICLSSSTCEVLQLGNHAMGTDDSPPPVKSKLTQQMKDYITDSI
ncbi:hypothetical protein GN958_ATG16551 [Phytophthora infestans]|uniref:Uncharacterized protein n=1 Tax=Phytophthora infestans TaxID=4787 RepID=A0A8S9TZX5_PHYIN|nr:hypothetical protein GN958_ATG16551 [Phytophthora infestans]